MRAEMRFPTTTPSETLARIITFFQQQQLIAPLTAIGIGSFGPLAGPVYMYGKLAMNGLEALFDKVNQEGGIHGRKLKLVREGYESVQKQVLIPKNARSILVMIPLKALAQAGPGATPSGTAANP